MDSLKLVLPLLTFRLRLHLHKGSNQFCQVLALRHSILVALYVRLDWFLGYHPVEPLATMAATPVEFLLAQLWMMAIDQVPRCFMAILQQEL